MESEEEQKQCPFCKKQIVKSATKCPYCQTDLSVSGNVANAMRAIGIILTICVTIPIILFACGMCGAGAF